MTHHDPEPLDGWLAAQQIALLVFTTPNCGVCNAIKPQLHQLTIDYPQLGLRYVDAEAEPEVAAAHNIFAVPVVELYVQGKESGRFARHFGMQEIEAAVARYHGLLFD